MTARLLGRALMLAATAARRTTKPLSSRWQAVAPAEAPYAARVLAPVRPLDPSELLYELLDAHYDTVRLASELASEPDWEAHLEYLRGLQRVGRETLAYLSLEAPV
jgi:hypothetical protein